MSDANTLPNSIAEHIFLTLRRQILLGELAPGERLLVLDIAGRFGVSQAPVREALERLKQEGLAVGRTNRGSSVSEATLKEVQDIYSIRQLVEGFAVRETTKRMRHTGFFELETIVEGMKEASRQHDSVRMVELDMDFHEYFYRHCGNQMLHQMWKQMRLKLERFIAITNKQYEPVLTFETHAALLEEIRSGDVEQAVRSILDTFQFNENSAHYQRREEAKGKKP